MRCLGIRHGKYGGDVQTLFAIIFSKRISIALFSGRRAFRSAWHLAPIAAIFHRSEHYSAEENNPYS
jgi:hypothetical protein